MAIQTITESIFSKEIPITDILLTFLSESIDYTGLIEELATTNIEEKEIL